MPDHDRDRMLDHLLGVMRRHHRWRRVRRRAVTTLAVVMVVGTAWATVARHLTSTSPPPPGPTIKWVSQNERTGVIRTMDDDELLGRLTEIRRPTGLIRVGDRAWVTVAVIDPDDETPSG